MSTVYRCIHATLQPGRTGTSTFYMAYICKCGNIHNYNCAIYEVLNKTVMTAPYHLAVNSMYVAVCSNSAVPDIL